MMSTIFLLLTVVCYSVSLGLSISELRLETRLARLWFSLAGAVLIILCAFAMTPPTTNTVKLAPEEVFVDSFSLSEYKIRCVIKRDNGSYYFRDIKLPQGSELSVIKSE